MVSGLALILFGCGAAANDDVDNGCIEGDCVAADDDVDNGCIEGDCIAADDDVDNGCIEGDCIAADEGVVAACIAAHPPSAPFDVGDVLVPAQPPVEPGAPPVIGVKPTVEDIARECMTSGGTSCDVSAFMSRDAAMCVARAGGLAEGERPWHVALGYFYRQQRVGWTIMTVRSIPTDEGYWGEGLSLDAITGDQVSRSIYSVIP